jgi:hypothetical protein
MIEERAIRRYEDEVAEYERELEEFRRLSEEYERRRRGNGQDGELEALYAELQQRRKRLDERFDRLNAQRAIIA